MRRGGRGGGGGGGGGVGGGIGRGAVEVCTNHVYIPYGHTDLCLIVHVANQQRQRKTLETGGET